MRSIYPISRVAIYRFCFYLSMSLIVALGKAYAVEQHKIANPETTITKNERGDWLVTFTLSEPSEKLVFLRQPDKSRMERWFPLDQQFEISSDGNGEYIRRKDNKSFSKVSFKLTPTYRSLIKDYAPFSPFSDGGSLTYSGRYFTCSMSCDDPENAWQFTMIPPAGEHVILDGKLHHGKVSWRDADDGRNIYVGKQHPIEDDAFIAVIDSELPAILKDVLSHQLPRLMTYFASHLGEVKGAKPMLFASYSNKPGSSAQGGTLPNQIFMHWDFDDLEERIQSQSYVHQTLWFFAHEAAHFFQKTQSGTELFGEPEHSWVHEGGADWLAQKALREMYPEMNDYIDDKVAQYKTHCDAGLREISLIQAAQAGQFMLHYSCGFFIHQSLENDIARHSQKDKDIYDLWGRFADIVEDGKPIGSATFWTAAEDLVPQQQLQGKMTVVNDSDTRAEMFWQALSPKT